MSDDTELSDIELDARVEAEREADDACYTVMPHICPAKDFISSHLLQINVKSETYFVHSRLLYAHSPKFLEKVVKSETGRETVELDEDPQCFRIICEWLYTTYVVVPGVEDREHYLRLIKAWGLATKLGIRDCANTILDAICEFLAKPTASTDTSITNVNPVGADALFIVAKLRLRRTSQFREFFLLRVAWEMTHHRELHETYPEGFLTPDYTKFWLEGGKMALHLIEYWYQISEMLAIRHDPATFRECSRHNHFLTSTCDQRYEAYEIAKQTTPTGSENSSTFPNEDTSTPVTVEENTSSVSVGANMLSARSSRESHDLSEKDRAIQYPEIDSCDRTRKCTPEDDIPRSNDVKILSGDENESKTRSRPVITASAIDKLRELVSIAHEQHTAATRNMTIRTRPSINKDGNSRKNSASVRRNFYSSSWRSVDKV